MPLIEEKGRGLASMGLLGSSCDAPRLGVGPFTSTIVTAGTPGPEGGGVVSGSPRTVMEGKPRC